MGSLLRCRSLQSERLIVTVLRNLRHGQRRYRDGKIKKQILPGCEREAKAATDDSQPGALLSLQR